MKNQWQSLVCSVTLLLLPAFQVHSLPGYHVNNEASVQKAVKQYASNSNKFRAVVYQAMLDKHSGPLALATHRYLLLKPNDPERKCSFATAYWQTQFPGVRQNISPKDVKQLQGLYQEAVQDTKEAAQKLPHSVAAHINYARYLQYFVYGTEKVPAMVREYQKVVALEPHQAEAHYALAMAYLGTGDYSVETSHKAIAELKQAVKLNPRLTESYSYMAASCSWVNNWKEAKFYLQQYIRVNPKAATRPDVVAVMKTANEKIAAGL